MLISGLLKLTPLPCLLSVQTFHLIAVITELQRGDHASCDRLPVAGENPELRCGNCLSGIAEPVQPGFAMGGKWGFTLVPFQRCHVYEFTSMSRKLE